MLGYLALFAFGVLVTLVVGARRGRGWADAAARVGGIHQAGEQPAMLQRFGHAPWHTWGRTERLYCSQSIAGGGPQASFWLLDIDHREPEVSGRSSLLTSTMAVVRLPGAAGPRLHPVPTGSKHEAWHNGAYLFVWEKAWGFGIGKRVRPDRLPGLLARALQLAPLAGSVAGGGAAPADETAPAIPPAPAKPRRGEADRDAPVLQVIAWLLIAVALWTQTTQWGRAVAIPIAALALLLAALGFDWRRVSAATHFMLLAGAALTASGFLLGLALGGLGAISVQGIATSSRTHRGPRGHAQWGYRPDK